MDVNRALKSDAKHRTDLVKIKGALETLARQIEDSVRVEYTGDFVLLKKSDDGWAFVAIYNPDTWEGDDPEWDQCMPIPKLETVPEFDGW